MRSSKVSMFKKRSLLTLLILTTLFGLAWIKIFIISEKNELDYLNTLEDLQPSKAQNRGTTERNLVTKSLWRQDQDVVYQYIISSKESFLHLNQLRARDTKIIEEMTEATCLLQQKKYFVDAEGNEVKSPKKGRYFPMQQVCRLQVDEGVYDYATKKFHGKRVEIQIYELPGHDLNPTPSFLLAKKVLEGHCDQIDFYFMEKVPNLKVQNLVAKIFGKMEN
jgi:hypothetical protein